MAKKRTKTPAPSAADIRRSTARLHAVKGAAMRDVKALQSIAPKPKGRQKRAHAATGGIHMGK